jgi:serine phosphatase RsbU (regulator of sigma subunit)
MLQRSVLPESLPEVLGASITARYRPAERDTEVGGDWYDAFALGDGNVVVIIGDVAGHGIEAAALMGRVRNAARAFAVEDPRPAELLRRLDHLLCTLDEDAFVTALAAVVNVHDATLEWARAGHPPALLCRDGRTEYLEDVGGTPLGSMVRPYESARRHIGHGALLVWFTDGLVERRARPIDEGLAWLAATVSHAGAGDLDALCDDLLAERFAGAPSEDDICIVALRVH